MLKQSFNYHEKKRTYTCKHCGVVKHEWNWDEHECLPPIKENEANKRMQEEDKEFWNWEGKQW